MLDPTVNLPDAATLISTVKKWMQWGWRSQEGDDFIICRFNWTVLIFQVFFQVLFVAMVSFVSHLIFIVPLAVMAPISLLGYTHFCRYSVTVNADGVSLQHGSWPFKISWHQIYSYKEETVSTLKPGVKVSFAEGLNAWLNLDRDEWSALIRFIAFFDKQGNRIGRLPMTFIPEGDKARVLQLVQANMLIQEKLRQQSMQAVVLP